MPRILTRLVYLFLFFLIPTITSGQVTAGFTVDHASGCVPLIVTFTNTSTGATSYSWDLGNGSMPTIANPVGTYVTAGTYTVTLTAYNGPSISSSSTVITVLPLPTPGFFTSTPTVCKDVPVSFTNTSFSTTMSPLTYLWNFGDGLTDTATNPNHTWDHSGAYNITLYATDTNGCTATFTRDTFIHVRTLPNANFGTATPYLCRPTNVHFTDSSTGFGPLTYAWSFGDGGTSTLSNPNHLYTTMGTTMNVELIVTDVHGCVDTTLRGNYIVTNGLTPDFTPNLTDTCINTEVSFLNTSTYHYVSLWSYGDGATSAGEIGVHTYTMAGTYPIRLVVYDGACWDTLIRPIIINPSPVASFTTTPADPCPTAQTFTYTATVPPGASTLWTFGAYGGSTATTNPATKSYSSSCMFFDQVLVTDTNGCQTTVTKRDSFLMINPQGRSDCAPVTVGFSSALETTLKDFTVMGPDYPTITIPYPYAITSYLWDFGDGSPTTTTPAPTHTYSVGNYINQLTVTTSHGCTKTINSGIKAITPPIVHITTPPDTICYGKSVTLSGTAGPASTFVWDYGDGMTEAGLGPKVHTYPMPGSFLVTFTGINMTDCAKTDTVRFVVDSPKSQMTVSQDCASPAAAVFGNISMGANSYVWMFGDGTTATNVSPVTHTYASMGIYPVRLATYNAASGCRDTVQVNVDLAPTTAVLNVTSRLLCYGTPDTLSAAISGLYSRYKWYVDGVLVDSLSDPAYDFHWTFPPGIHTVSLALRNMRGCWDTFALSGTIKVSNPMAAFTVSPPSGCSNMPFVFTDASTNVLPIPIADYNWNFYDGPLSSGPASSVSHTFLGGLSGIRPVRETITDTLGCTSTSIAAVNLYKPVMDFNRNVSMACIGDTIRLTNLSLDIASSVWFFGDGTSATTMNATHVYSASGVYTVTLTVTDIHGCHDTLRRPAYITINPSPVAAFTMDDTFAVCPPLNVNFTNNSIGAGSYYWRFGNGGISYAINPSNPYTAAGSYTIALVAYNLLGCTDTAYGHASVFGYTGAFTYTPISGCNPLPVHFSIALGGAANLVWDFSDGYIATSTLDTISHSYTLPGAYVPKLILTDSSGCTAFSYGTDTIKVNNLTAWFRINPNPVCVNDPITFTDSSYSTYPSTNTYLWSFGGGATSTLANPVYTYTISGVQTVTLTVTNSAGCSRTVTRTVTVNALPTYTGSLAICVGYTSTLSGVPFGGTWTGGAAGIATISSSGVINGLAGGTAQVTYTSPLGCKTIAVATVHTLPGSVSGDSVMCQSNSVTLSTTSPGGTWGSASSAVTVGSTSGIVTGISPGVAVITYALGSGCYVTKQVTVNPGIAPVAGPSPLCVGTAGTFTTTSTGGSWSSSNTTVATIGSITGILAPLAGGTATITYKQPTGCYATTSVTVHPIPNAITGDSTVCQSASVSLAATPVGGTWSSSAPATAFVNVINGVVTGLAPGTAHITYTLSTGCFITKQVTVNSAISPVSGPAMICAGTAASFTTSTTGGYWLSSDTNVAVIDSFTGLMMPVTGGVATITYQQSTGCSASRVVTVLPLPGPITGTLSVCHYATTTLSDTSVGGTWTSLMPTVASVGTSGIVTGVLPGTAIIGYIMPNGCSRSVIVTVNPLPPAITGIMTVCVGNTVTLGNTATGGAWTTGTPATILVGIASGVVTGLAPGAGFTTYTLPTGCMTSTMVTVLAVPPPIVGGPTVCGGFAINLTNPLPGGTWSSPGAPFIATFNPVTAVVVGITPGTITVSYTISNGCAATQVITVNPLPPAIGGVASVCVNSTTTLTNFISPGTWTTGNASIALIDTTTGIVTGVNNGTVEITYTINTGCFNIREVTVHPLPANIVGTSVLCEGSMTVFTNATIGGTWGSYNPPVATVAPVGLGLGMVTAVSAGTATISYKLPLTGCFTTKNVTVNAVPPPISGSGHICLGTTRTLTTGAPGGTWSSSNPGIAPITTSGVVTGLALGTAIIDYVLPVTGCSTSRMVTVQPLPTMFNVTGGGSYCAGGPGVHVGLTGSQIGVSYALYYGASATGYLTGTNLPLDFGLMTLGGVYTVQATNPVTGCMRNMAGSATVVVTPPVVPGVSIHTAPGDTTCPGTMASVSPIAVNGGPSPTYVWKVNGTTVSTAPAYSFIPADGDVVAVTMTSSATCILPDTAYAEKVLHVIPYMMPAVTLSVEPGDTVCQYELVTYIANPSFGGAMPAYTWMVNSTLAGVGPVFSYVPVNGDVVKCHMMSNYLCRLADTAFSGSVSMTVDSLITPHIFVTPHPGYAVDSGTMVRFTTVVTDAGTSPTYQWFINGVPVIGATADTFQCNTLHHYDSVTCGVTSSGVCNDITSFDWVFISVSPVAVSQVATATDIRLVPNPNNGTFTIKGTWGATDEDIDAEVTNMLGQVVYKGTVNARNGKVNQSIQLLNTLANGMYMLNIRTQHESKVFHFVVEQ